MNDLETVADLLKALDGVEWVITDIDERRLTLQTSSGSLTSEVMSILSDFDYHIKPGGGPDFIAEPEENGSLLAFPPEVWGEIIRTVERAEEILDDPVEFAKVCAEFAESEEFEADSVEEAAEEFRGHTEAFQALIAPLPDEIREDLRGYEVDGDFSEIDWTDRLVAESRLDGQHKFGVVRYDPDDPPGKDDVDAELKGKTPGPSDVLRHLPSEGTKQRLVFDTLLENGPMTTEEVIEESGYENAGPVLSEFKSDGLVTTVDEDEVGPNYTNRYVWDVHGVVREALEVAE